MLFVLTFDGIENALFIYGNGKLDLKFLLRHCRNRVAKYFYLRERKVPRLNRDMYTSKTENAEQNNKAMSFVEKYFV